MVVPVSVWLVFCDVLEVVLVLEEERPMGCLSRKRAALGPPCVGVRYVINYQQRVAPCAVDPERAKEPPTTCEIATQMLLERAMDTDDVRMLRTMTKRVAAARREQRDRGRAVSEDRPGTYQLWEVVR